MSGLSAVFSRRHFGSCRPRRTRGNPLSGTSPGSMDRKRRRTPPMMHRREDCEFEGSGWFACRNLFSTWPLSMLDPCSIVPPVATYPLDIHRRSFDRNPCCRLSANMAVPVEKFIVPDVAAIWKGIPPADWVSMISENTRARATKQPNETEFRRFEHFVRKIPPLGLYEEETDLLDHRVTTRLDLGAPTQGPPASSWAGRPLSGRRNLGHTAGGDRRPVRPDQAIGFVDRRFMPRGRTRRTRSLPVSPRTTATRTS